jgi:hypothetical protein
VQDNATFESLEFPMTSSRPAYLADLDAASTALRDVLGAIIRTERLFGPAASPLELLKQITSSLEWAWLQPLYQLIADVDHAMHTDELPASEVAAIGAHARALLSGHGAPVEQHFLDRYRALLQTNPEIAIAHGAALQALRKLPPEPETEGDRLHARHQWAMRLKHRVRHR